MNKVWLLVPVLLIYRFFFGVHDHVYIKTTKNTAGQAYYHLVESYREGSKVRQRTLLSLGRVEDNKLQELAGALAKHTDLLSAADIAKSISVKDTFVLGPLLIVERLFEQLGINAALTRIEKKQPKLELDLKKVVFSLVVARFLRPSSKLCVFDEQLGKLYPEMFENDIALQHLYRAVDVLAAHKDDIESSLYWHGRDLLTASVDVVLYDLTTLRFESTREDLGKLRRFGFSKEKRSDCTQVVLGLLVDQNGIPLGFEVYPGNTFEGNTLKDIVEKMAKKFKVRRFIFVADRGLFSKKNIAELKAYGGEFIVGMRLDQAKDRHAEFYDKTRFLALSDELSILETTFHDDRCIVTWSKKRDDRDKKVRADILEKMKKKLGKAKTAKDFVSNENYRRFLKGLDDGEAPAIDQDKIAQAEKRDGFFGLLTNVKDKKAAELVTHYKELWKIEDAFGEFKGTLKARPIFHWKDNRILGHLTMCFIAQLCEAHLTHVMRSTDEKLKSKSVEQQTIDERQLTAPMAMREVCEVRAIPVKIGSQTIWVRTDINGHAAKLFKSLGVRIPAKVLKTKNVVAQADPDPDPVTV